MRTDRGPSSSRGRRHWRQLSCLGGLLLVLALIPGGVFATETVELEISGVSGEARENVRASLSLGRARGARDLGAETIRELHGAAEREILRALEPFGY